MQKTSGLGRGLSSLIPNKKISTTSDGNAVIEEILDRQEQVIAIPVEKISPNPHQPRSLFKEEQLQELMESIKEHGIILPLIVTRDKNDNYQLIAGERRWRAAKAIGLETVPAIVRELSEQKKMEIALIENLQRQDLNALETAFAYQKLIDEFNLTQEQLGKKVGKSRAAITNTLRILNVCQDVKDAILAGEITEGHARVLAGLPDEADQLSMLKKITSAGLNVRETEKAGKDIVVAKHIRKVSFDPDVKAKEERLQQSLSTKVEIKKFGSSGQIIIKFFSEEELAEIVRKILNQ